jgi:hypothetical protein
MVRSWRIPFLYALGVGLWAWQTSWSPSRIT